MKALKYSRQRESIKEFLQTRHDHPTADTIYENIRRIYPNISLGTVYRNLSLLAEIGEIAKISAPGGAADRFDPNVVPHNHFICSSCGRLLDLEMSNIDFITELASKNFHGQINGYTAHFYGLCEDCLKNRPHEPSTDPSLEETGNKK